MIASVQESRVARIVIIIAVLKKRAPQLAG